jgi:hypothetical protein
MAKHARRFTMKEASALLDSKIAASQRSVRALEGYIEKLGGIAALSAKPLEFLRKRTAAKFA